MKNNLINRYLRKVKKFCPYSIRNRLIRELENDLTDYLNDNPGASFYDIEQYFGNPDNLALEYLYNSDGKLMQKRRGALSYIEKTFLIITATAVILGLSARIIRFLRSLTLHQKTS